MQITFLEGGPVCYDSLGGPGRLGTEAALSAVSSLVAPAALCAVGSLVAPAAWVRLPLPGLGPRKAQDPNPNGCKKEAVETETATDKAVKTETIALILCLLISFVSFLVCRPFGPF